MARGNQTLSKSYTYTSGGRTYTREIDSNSLNADESFYYHYKVRYDDIANSNRKRIYVKAYVMRTGDENITISGVTLHVKLSGTEVASASGGMSTSGRGTDNGSGVETYFDVDYDSNGTWSNKYINCYMTGGSATYSASGSAGSGASSNARGDGAGYISLPEIPTATVSSSLYQNGFHNYVVAGHSKIQVTVNFTNTKKIVVRYIKDGVTSGSYTIRNTSSGSGAVTHSVFVPPSSASDYTLTVQVELGNDNGTITKEATQAVKGYSLPTYSSASYTVRCDSAGTANSQGEYGKLHLAWNSTSITPVDASNPNTLQTLLVKVSRNGTEETLFNGTAPSSGVLDLIFPLAVNVQGDMIVKFTDQIDANTVTSLVVPKSTMPLSMYQDGDDVGVAIGRMATEGGFWVYEQMYLKDPDSSTVYRIYIENGVLKGTAI